MDVAETVERALDLLTANYVFPDQAERIAVDLRRRVAAGEYADLSGRALCEALTRDMHAVHSDRHLRLMWRDEPRDEDDRAEAERRATRDWEEQLRLSGLGVHSVSVLDGNVGLLDLRSVPRPALVGEAWAAAMRLVSRTFALILDLRANGGGTPEGAALLCSYFFADEPVHLNDIRRPAANEVKQMWSYADVPAPRYLDRPVYVLIGGRTFSGAEDIAYTLQAHGRATIVGEPSRGGAHPTVVEAVNAHIDIRVPSARTVSTVTGDNWEGGGVTPDVTADEDGSFDEAYRRALTHVAALPGDDQSLSGVRKTATKRLADG